MAKAIFSGSNFFSIEIFLSIYLALAGACRKSIAYGKEKKKKYSLTFYDGFRQNTMLGKTIRMFR